MKVHDNKKLAPVLNELNLEMIRLMPSSGEWPFQMEAFSAADPLDEMLNIDVATPDYLLFSLKADYTKKDVMNYVEHSKEYLSCNYETKNLLLSKYEQSIVTAEDLRVWIRNATSIGIGLAIQSLKARKVGVESIEMDLQPLNYTLGLSSKNLQAYHLFELFLNN